MPMAFRPGISTLAGYALAFLLASGLHALAVPLAWILGPLLVAAALSLAGVKLTPPVWLRQFGQLAIGATVGLNMTAAVLVQLVGWFPLMVISGLVMIAISAVFSVLLARLARIDTRSAFFANLPGGLAEMGNVGERAGAQPEPIAIVQSLRVAIIVLLVPPLLIILGYSRVPPSTDPILSAPSVVLLLVAGSLGALLLHALRLNNPWTIGSMLCTATLAANGIVAGHMPTAIFFLAQLLLGYAVGSRFRPGMIRKLPRVTAAGAMTVLGIGAIMAGYATVVSIIFGLDPMTAMLATAPGGMSEMAATAQTLHLGVALVVAFQMVRAVLVNSLASVYWAAFSRSGLLALLERLVRVPLPMTYQPPQKPQ